MMLLIFEMSRSDPKAPSLAKVWVNATDAAQAESMARRKLAADGYVIEALVEATATEKSDYFPPCKSLDAFEQAQVDGVCALYS